MNWLFIIYTSRSPAVLSWSPCDVCIYPKKESDKAPLDGDNLFIVGRSIDTTIGDRQASLSGNAIVTSISHNVAYLEVKLFDSVALHVKTSLVIRTTQPFTRRIA